MKKLLIFLLIVFLLSGCTSNYNLEISNNSFKENINATINKNEIPTSSPYPEIELDDQITPFLNKDYSAIFSDDKALYKKRVTYLDNYINVDMSYKYNEQEFYNSNSLKLCFDNYEFSYEDDYYIHAYGRFYCLYSDSLDINIKTNNKVLSHNADEVNGNTYTWHVNKDNLDNLDINIKVDKGINKETITTIIIVIFIIIILSIVGLVVYKKGSKENKI